MSLHQRPYRLRDSGDSSALIREKDVLCEDVVGPLPESEHSISLSVGDDLVLTPFEIVGKAAVHNEDDVIYRPAQIGCSLATVFSDAEPGERIFFDDGRIGGVIRELHQEEGQPWLEVKITQAAKGTAKLRSEKGINLPDTELGISALTEGPGRSGICCQVRRLGLSLFCAVAGRRCGTN